MSTLRFLFVTGNSDISGSMPIPGNISQMQVYDVAQTDVSGNIPSELCGASRGLSINVSSTGINCYSGCLTSSQVVVTGASSECTTGRVTMRFLITLFSIIFCCCVLSFGGRWGNDVKHPE